MVRMRKKDDEEDDVEVMFDLKHIIEKSSNTIAFDSEDGSVKKIQSELENLNKKVEDLKDVVVGVKKDGESKRKKNVKKEIVRILQEKTRLNPAQLGKILGLSRVRSNEYLREMEDERIVKGMLIKKKKFYMLESDIAGKPREGAD